MTRLRGLLAERRITHLTFAKTAGLSVWYVSRMLVGTTPINPTARAKFERAAARLGLTPDWQVGTHG
jgi:DNA-binding LacI/PurR family transcriptional regulator